MIVRILQGSSSVQCGSFYLFFLIDHRALHSPPSLTVLVCLSVYRARDEEEERASRSLLEIPRRKTIISWCHSTLKPPVQYRSRRYQTCYRLCRIAGRYAKRANVYESCRILIRRLASMKARRRIGRVCTSREWQHRIQSVYTRSSLCKKSSRSYDYAPLRMA